MNSDILPTPPAACSQVSSYDRGLPDVSNARRQSRAPNACTSRTHMTKGRFCGPACAGWKRRTRSATKGVELEGRAVEVAARLKRRHRLPAAAAVRRVQLDPARRHVTVAVEAPEDVDGRHALGLLELAARSSAAPGSRPRPSCPGCSASRRSRARRSRRPSAGARCSRRKTNRPSRPARARRRSRAAAAARASPRASASFDRTAPSGLRRRSLRRGRRARRAAGAARPRRRRASTPDRRGAASSPPAAPARPSRAKRVRSCPHTSQTASPSSTLAPHTRQTSASPAASAEIGCV